MTEAEGNAATPEAPEASDGLTIDLDVLFARLGRQGLQIEVLEGQLAEALRRLAQYEKKDESPPASTE